GKGRGFTARSLRPSHPPLTSAYAIRGAFAGRRRPLCVRGCRVPGSVRPTDEHGPAHGRARTSHGRGRKGHGRGRWERLRCLLGVAVALVTGVFLVVAGAEGLGDALVGGIRLPVDAVRVDLEQDRDAVPGAAG